MKRILFFVYSFFALQVGGLHAQEDSTKQIEEILVKGFESNAKLVQVPASISVLTKTSLQRVSTYSLLPAFNSVAGVRMEERSPGSYRLSIRGSLLRSPFGVRNVKLYLDDFLFSDAGGNAYINLLDINNISRAEIIKGPAGSIYGAGTGGAVLLSGNALLSEALVDTSRLQVRIAGGSFGSLHQSVQYQKNTSAYTLQLLQSHNQSDGYRTQSRMRKDNLQLRVKFKESRKYSADFLLLFSDLSYQTPGGLNQVQLLANPRQSRPATPTLPSAQAQEAQIFNKTALLGYSTTFKLNNHWKTVSSFSASFTGFRNPFITNYERRNELNIGIRTKFVYENNKRIPYQWITGVEVQRGDYRIDSTGNIGGKPDANLVRDEVMAKQQFAFSQVNVDPFSFLKIQAGFSFNYFGYNIARTIGVPANGKVPVNFGNQFLPRVAMSFLPSQGLSVYAQIAKGYSSPTIAEIRPSAGGVYSGLQSEFGWNKEVGVKWSALNGRFSISTSFFRFDLKEAIVRQTNSAGAEYFTNAGKVIQKGIESEFSWLLLNKPGSKNINVLQLQGSMTLNDFKFGDYQLGNNNFKNNKLTGVPNQVFTAGVYAAYLKNYYLNLNFNYTGSMPLNDANVVFAAPYRLWQGKAGWKGKLKGHVVDLFLLLDNMSNQQYSLGNDINAFGGRFFNPAPRKNFLFGCAVDF